MKETIVYLPRSANSFTLSPDALVFNADEVVAALDAAGVKWVQETPEELKIRMMSLQIEELKDVCTKLQRDLKEALTENGALAGCLVDEKKEVEKLQAQLKDAQAENGSLAGLLADAQKQIDELDDQNEALKMTISDKSRQIERLERGPNANW